MSLQLLGYILLLVAGFILLIKGADYFVEGSSSVAARFQVPSLIIGMTIVAMGTSLPECSVSVTASLANQNSLAISNAIGSNIFNLMMVCGICSIVTPLIVQKGTLKKDFPLSVLFTLLLLGLGYVGMEVSQLDGVILLVCFVLFLLYMIFSAKKARANADATEENTKIIPIWKSIIFIVGGATAIKFGGDFVVDSASNIATTFGMSQTLVGLTICAIGTSLPELVTSLVAAKKNELDMAVGNVIGSNIFNILFVLGIGASISPISFNMENVIDIIVLTAMSALVWIFAWSKERINRIEGIAMVGAYVVYWIYICIR